MEHLPTNPEAGLSREEVRARTQQGLVNGEEDVKTQSIGQIVRKTL